jgi:hypothetical protein
MRKNRIIVSICLVLTVIFGAINLYTFFALIALGGRPMFSVFTLIAVVVCIATAALQIVWLRRNRRQDNDGPPHLRPVR